MRLRVLQHVDFEGPAAVAEWAGARGWRVDVSRLDRGEALPSADAFDLLVVMGGPMSVNDERAFPWLVDEKRLVRGAIDAGRAVLGICLGAQLIASACGARVYASAEKEIGWFPVRQVTTAGVGAVVVVVGAVLPEAFTPLHWHGETFDLPEGATRLAETDAVPNQAFSLGGRVVGLQFHLEATPQSVRELVEHAGHEIRVGGRYQQPAEAIVAGADRASAAVRPVLFALLDAMTS